MKHIAGRIILSDQLLRQSLAIQTAHEELNWIASHWDEATPEQRQRWEEFNEAAHPDGGLMGTFGVKCTMGDGNDAIITVQVATADDALAEVWSHQRMFGPGDAAGNWLASKRDPAKTIVRIHEEVREL